MRIFRRNFSISYKPLAARIRELSKEEAEINRAGMTPAQLDARKQRLRSVLEAVLISLDLDSPTFVQEIRRQEMYFSEVALKLTEELEKLFNEKSNDKVKRSIIFALLILEDDYPRSVIKLISPKKKGESSDSCVNILGSLPNKKKETFLRKVYPYDEVGLDNLSEALITISNEDPQLLLKSLIHKMKQCDKKFEFTTLEEKLLLNVISKFIERNIDIPLECISYLYKSSTEKGFKDELWKLIKQEVQKNPAKKTQIINLLKGVIESESELDNDAMRLKLVAVEHLTDLLEGECVEDLCELLPSKYPFVIYRIIDILSSGKFGEHGKERLVKEIAAEARSGNPLPLAELSWTIKAHSDYKEITHRVFSLTNVDLAKAYSEVEDVDLFLGTRENVDKVYALGIIHHRKSKDIIGNIDFHRTLIDWILHDRNETVRENAAKVLNLLDDLQLKGLLTSTEEGGGKELKEAVS